MPSLSITFLSLRKARSTGSPFFILISITADITVPYHACLPDSADFPTYTIVNYIT